MKYPGGFFQIILLVIGAAFLVGIGAGFWYFKNLSAEPEMPVVGKPVIVEQAIPALEIKEEKLSAPLPAPAKKDTARTLDPWKDATQQVPTNLALPLVVADIEETETVLSPYGIIRKSGDGGIGHGGIDFPLRKGSPIYAVASGTIIKNNLEDPGGGKTVDILIMPGKFQGEGWIFKYDHVNLGPGLKVGDNVEKGQQIGTNAFVERGNNHIGLEYHIKNFTIAREKICWVDRLEMAARQQLEYAFDRIKKTPAFLQFWQTANEDGSYQYKGLLDETKYPDGPQLCYPLGTDARVTVN